MPDTIVAGGRIMNHPFLDLFPALLGSLKTL
jgi:hypothetical protein